jgi:electron transport complex protein RnfC
MKMLSFKGGITPPERKELSNKMPIEVAFPSTKTVSIPVTQGGAPNQPIVKVGDIVVRGQKIAESDAFMSAPVHASVSGKIKKIENRLTSTNTDALCIIIEADESQETDFMPKMDPFTVSKKDAIQRVKDAGIVGMGGAAFPTHVKLSIPAGKNIDFVLVNAAECEPYLTIDERNLQEKTDAIIDGLSIAMHIVDAEAGSVVLEENKAYLIPTIEDSIKKAGFTEKMGVVLVKTKYPQGGEKNIITAATGREIPAKGLPADAGCVVQNVGTLIAISEAFREGKPLIDRPLTISGEVVKQPKNLIVPVGTVIGDLIPEVIQLEGNVAKILSGGPMMGFSVMNANFPVAKNTSGVLFMRQEELCLEEETPCINCGKCVEVCSCRLYPVLISKSLKAGDMKAAVKYGLMDCVDCGTCQYSCPANIKLVQRIRTGKGIFRAELAAERAKKVAKEGK